MSEKKPFEFGSFIGGAFLTGVMGIPAVFMLLGLVNSFSKLSYLGLVQWLYILPMFWFAKRSGRSSLAAGFLVGGGIVWLINSACFGPFWAPNPNVL